MGRREAVQVRERSRRGNLEHRARAVHSVGLGGAVEVAVAALDQRRHGVGPGGGSKVREAVQGGVSSRRADAEHGARAVPAQAGGAVEVAVAALDHAGVGLRPVVAVAEAAEDRQPSGGRHPEDRAAADGSTLLGGAVEVAVAALDERPQKGLAHRPDNP